MAKKPRVKPQTITIKKYANRRLYNTGTSSYVTLDDLAELVRAEQEFNVIDAKTGEDLTHGVLTQIILEQESKGQNLLPVNFLRHLIKFYGDSMERFVPSYLELSMETLAQEQVRYREQLQAAMSASPIDALQAQTQRNLEMFEHAMSMMTSLAGLPAAAADGTADTATGGKTGAAAKSGSEAGAGSAPAHIEAARKSAISQQVLRDAAAGLCDCGTGQSAAGRPASKREKNPNGAMGGGTASSEISDLKDQLAQIQEKLDRLST